MFCFVCVWSGKVTTKVKTVLTQLLSTTGWNPDVVCCVVPLSVLMFLFSATWIYKLMSDLSTLEYLASLSVPLNDLFITFCFHFVPRDKQRGFFTVLLQHNRKLSESVPLTVNTLMTLHSCSRWGQRSDCCSPCKWSVRGLLPQTYLRFSLANTGQEDDVSHEEADAQVQVDGGAGALYGAAELERQDAQYQTQYGDDQAYLRQQNELKGMLGESTRQILTLMTRPIWEILCECVYSKAHSNSWGKYPSLTYIYKNGGKKKVKDQIEVQQ